MNVSDKADAAFMRELERTDPQRYANLQRNMRLSIPVENSSLYRLKIPHP